MRVYIVGQPKNDLEGEIKQAARAANIDVAVYNNRTSDAILSNFISGYVDRGDRFFFCDPCDNGIVEVAKLSYHYKIPVEIRYEVADLFQNCVNNSAVNGRDNEEKTCDSLCAPADVMGAEWEDPRD
jgi:hypothetical protein